MSANIFDNLQAGMFDVVTNTMGYDATWTPSAGGSQQTARVLLKKPTEKRSYENETIDFEPNAYMVEYKEGDFPTLKSIVDAIGSATSAEVMNVDGIDYYVKSLPQKWDGKTNVAKLILKSSVL